MKELSKQYQIWYYSDSGYHLREFDNINECIEHIEELYTNNFYITKKVKIDIKEDLSPKKSNTEKKNK